MSQEQPPFGLPGPVLAGIQRRPDPGLIMTPPLYFFRFRYYFQSNAILGIFTF